LGLINYVCEITELILIRQIYKVIGGYYSVNHL